MTRTILALIIMLTAAQSWAMNYPHPSTFATKAAQTNYSTNRQRDIAALQSGKASTLHASTHATGGSDPITPAAIGAATAAQGAKADSALQPNGSGALMVDGWAKDPLGGTPTQGHYMSPNINPWEVKLWDQNSLYHPAFQIDKTITNSYSDRLGGYVSLHRSGPGLAGSALFVENAVLPGTTNVYDIGTTSLMRNDTGNGVIWGTWTYAAGPSSSVSSVSGSGAVVGNETNVFVTNDAGYKETRGGGTWSAGQQNVPMDSANIGRGQELTGKNGNFGFITASITQDHYVGWYVSYATDTDSTVPGGTEMLFGGGSTALKAPGTMIKARNKYFDKGIDLSNGVFAGPVIKTSPSQTYSDGTLTKTLDQLFTGKATSKSCSAGNHISSYDSSTGGFTCSPDTTSSEGVTDTNAVHVNAGNEISSITTKTTPAAGDYLLIEDTAAGNAKKKITVGSIQGAGGTVTAVSSANLDIAVSNGSSTPQLTLNSGTGANQIVKLNADAGINLDGSGWITGTGTVTATKASLVANTAGSFSVLSSGASIKLSSGTTVEVLSVADGSNLLLNANVTASALTWSYKNPSTVLKSGGVDVLYAKGTGAIGLKGDGNVMPKVYLHAWGGNSQVLGMRLNGTPAAPTSIVANDTLFSVAGGGYSSAGSLPIGGVIQFKAAENWTAGASGTAIAFSPTPNGAVVTTETMRLQQGLGIGTTADPGLGNLSVANFIITGYTALTDASATITTDTTRLTCTTTTARTLTLPATAKKGTSTANLTVVGSGAAASVTFAVEAGGTISWGDAGAPATTDTVASGKRQRYSCVSENAADTTTAAWDCYTAGGPF